MGIFVHILSSRCMYKMLLIVERVTANEETTYKIICGVSNPRVASDIMKDHPEYEMIRIPYKYGNTLW